MRKKSYGFYEHGWDLLADLTYAQYEISNFAKPGAECRHNMNTWRMHEWIGCGPSAASQYRGERYQRPANLEEWCLGMESTTSPKTERITLDDTLLLADAVIFGLRMNCGVDLQSLSLRFAQATNLIGLETKLKLFEEEGLLKSKGTHYQLTHQGRLLCDSVGSALLDV
jgi:oxygen-independent coproporphyrinogen-3 oxidase